MKKCGTSRYQETREIYKSDERKIQITVASSTQMKRGARNRGLWKGLRIISFKQTKRKKKKEKKRKKKEKGMK